MTPEQMDDALEGLDLLIEKRIAVVKAVMFERRQTHYEHPPTVWHWAQEHARVLDSLADELRDAYNARTALRAERDQASLQPKSPDYVIEGEP